MVSGTPVATSSLVTIRSTSRTVLLAGSIAFVVYFATLAPDLTWAYDSSDGGELITAAATLGVPHPPGYPTYVLLGHLATRLPAGTIAYRLNLFSALTAAIATAFTAAAALHLEKDNSPRSHVAALAAALTLAFMPMVWQQALVAEVYALNLMLVAMLLWALLSDRPVSLTGLLFGLALTTHATSALLLPLVAGLTPVRQWSRLLAATVLGLAPLLALPLLARGDSIVAWGQPQQLNGWWWLITARLYRPNLFALPPAELAERLWHWLPLLGQQFLFLGLFLLPPAGQRLPRRPLSLLVLSALLILLFALGYRPAGAVVLLLPALLLTSLLLVPGLGRLGPAGLLLPAALLLLNFNRLDLSHDRQARAVAEPLLAAAPPQAILLTEGDRTTFTFWYLQAVEGQRPDLVVIDRNLFGFDWYRQQLDRQHAWLPYIAAYDLAPLDHLGRPVCRVKLHADYADFDCL